MTRNLATLARFAVGFSLTWKSGNESGNSNSCPISSAASTGGLVAR
jgi:hypothetical protein